MASTVPDEIKVLSRDFQDHYRDLCVQVDNLTSISADLQRLRVQVARGSSAPSPSVVFFRITTGVECDWDPVEYENCGESFSGIPYPGQILSFSEDSGGTCMSVDGNGTGIDLSIAINEPCVSPDSVDFRPQNLKEGTVVMGMLVSPSKVIFCSNMPRLGVEC